MTLDETSGKLQKTTGIFRKLHIICRILLVNFASAALLQSMSERPGALKLVFTNKLNLLQIFLLFLFFFHKSKVMCQTITPIYKRKYQHEQGEDYHT